MRPELWEQMLLVTTAVYVFIRGGCEAIVAWRKRSELAKAARMREDQ